MFKEEVLHCEGEALQYVAQRACVCPIPGGVQVQVEWGFEQPGQEESVPSQCRAFGTR